MNKREVPTKTTETKIELNERPEKHQTRKIFNYRCSDYVFRSVLFDIAIQNAAKNIFYWAKYVEISGKTV